MVASQIPSLEPDIRLYGDVTDEMFETFYKELKEAEKKGGPIILCLTTSGGDPDAARRMAMEIRLSHEKKGKEIYFLGKTIVYSAGMVIMAGFPKEYRFITDDVVLMVHERRVKKTIQIDGPMRNNIETLEEKLAEFKNAQMLEKRDYRDLARGSNLAPDEVVARAMTNWYITAQEALDFGLVQAIV